MYVFYWWFFLHSSDFFCVKFQGLMMRWLTRFLVSDNACTQKPAAKTSTCRHTTRASTTSARSTSVRIRCVQSRLRGRTRLRRRRRRTTRAPYLICSTVSFTKSITIDLTTRVAKFLVNCSKSSSSSSAHYSPLLDIGLSNFLPSRSILDYSVDDRARSHPAPASRAPQIVTPPVLQAV
jgi:hypothetical protein